MPGPAVITIRPRSRSKESRGSISYQSPRMTYEPVSATLGRFEVEPLDRGFGHTFGNSLRRVLLSSLEGAAVTSVRIEGVQHEFTTIPGVREDVTDIILNLREMVCRLHGEVGEIEVELSKVGPGHGHRRRYLGARGPRDPEPGARDREPRGGLAPRHDPHDQPRPRVRPGRAEQGPGHHDRRDPRDSNFSPVLRVRYEVSPARVGQRTDYDKLLLEIQTDGSVDPRGASRRPRRRSSGASRSSPTRRARSSWASRPWRRSPPAAACTTS